MRKRSFLYNLLENALFVGIKKFIHEGFFKAEKTFKLGFLSDVCVQDSGLATLPINYLFAEVVKFRFGGRLGVCLYSKK
jgi:hypothetical protein